MMRKCYYETVSEDISICLDPDVGYYHHFKPGEILCFCETDGRVILEYIDYEGYIYNISVINPRLITNWDRWCIRHLTLREMLNAKYFNDVTESYKIDIKLNLILE